MNASDDGAESTDFEDEFERLLEEDPRAALAEAQDWVDEEPNSADAHYALGLAYEAVKMEREKIASFLRVLELDALDDGAPIADYERIIAAEVVATLAELPAKFTELLGAVAILIERRPSRDLVEEGFDPRLLGLFDGATSAELESADTPATATRIVIYSHNLASSFEDEASLRDEVRVTVLHEVGHFFGLDEDDLDRLGLG
jgi:predicted Zn-dependent protease with MMP-like domain